MLEVMLPIVHLLYIAHCAVIPGPSISTTVNYAELLPSCATDYHESSVYRTYPVSRELDRYEYVNAGTWIAMGKYAKLVETVLYELECESFRGGNPTAILKRLRMKIDERKKNGVT